MVIIFLSNFCNFVEVFVIISGLHYNSLWIFSAGFFFFFVIFSLNLNISLFLKQYMRRMKLFIYLNYNYNFCLKLKILSHYRFVLTR